MAKTSSQPPDKGKPKPESPAKPTTTTSPRIISRRVFNDFAAI